MSKTVKSAFEKIAFCLQHSGTKYWYFISDKQSTARCAVMFRSALHIALLVASFDVALPSEHKKPNLLAEWTEQSRFPPSLVEFCSVCSSRAGSVFEWAITQPLCAMIHDIISTSCAYVLSLQLETTRVPPQAARGMGLRKVSYEAFPFSVIFEKSGKNEATDLEVSQLWGSTIAIISAHVPGPHMWASAGPGPAFKFSETVEVWW